MEKKNIFWGLAFIAIAVLIIASQFGMLKDIGFWKIFLTIVFASILFDGIKEFGIGRILFAIAFLCIVWDEQLGITKLTPWPVLGAAFFGTIGFGLIFKKRRRKNLYKKHPGMEQAEKIYHKAADFDERVNQKGASVEYDNGDAVYCRTKFGATTKYVNSTNLQSVTIDASFGAAVVYLDKAQVPGGVVYVNIENSFSGVKIYIPKSWRVENHIKSTFAGVDITKGTPTGENLVTMVLEGNANFSGVEIFYI